MLCCQFLIDGRVQGVGYRNFASFRANEIGLVGWVRNLDDGRVEAMAQGSEQQLKEFAVLLSQGPLRAQVNQVERILVKKALSETSFMVLDDAEAPWQNK